LLANHAANAAVLPCPSQATVKSDASVSIVGAIVSIIVNVAVVLVALPHESVAVNVTVAAPVAPQPSLKTVKLFVHLTPLHTSLADAPPLLANHAANAAVLPCPSHATVKSDASVSIVGAIVSIIVNVAVVLVALPHESVAVNVTVAAPVAPQPSLKPVKLFVHLTPLHTSLALAPPLLANHAANAAVLPCPSQATVKSDASVSIVGAIVSMIVNVAVVLVALPQESVAVNVTVAAPVAPQPSLKPCEVVCPSYTTAYIACTCTTVACQPCC
jgi:uncharacterized protein (DUF736 family)